MKKNLIAVWRLKRACDRHWLVNSPRNHENFEQHYQLIKELTRKMYVGSR